ncbi:microcystin degradation protein MlrC, partial [Myxococcus llanfairpwllgwyngyllgogerychwyrndrobwllllantysiliogogogochensis]
QLADGADRPVLLLDHGDNCMSGGTCDSMNELMAAGMGAHTTVRLGNKVPLTQLGVAKEPVAVEGTVVAISDGEYTVTGPIYTGQRCAMGRTVLFDTGKARIVVTERTHEPWDLGVFSCVGMDPKAHRFVLLKSRMY